MPYNDALAAAQHKLGNRTRIREEIYEMNTVAFLETMARDARYGLRRLQQNPMFTAIALLTLVIGIGANTAVFCVVNSILLRPLSYPDPDRLVALRQLAPGATGLASFADGLLLSPAMYFTYAEHNRTFRFMGVWTTGTANVTGVAEPEQVRVAFVSDGVLQTLAVSPALGRWLSPGDQLPQGAKTAMLSYGYWQRRFGGDPAVIGGRIKVDAKPRDIVGVMPRGFRLVDSDFDLILPVAFDRAALGLAGFGYAGIARLKPGVTIPRADGDLAGMLPVWMDSWSNGPGTNPHYYDLWRITPAIVSLKQSVIGNIGDVLWVVMGTIGLVLLIACANVSNLLLVRAEARQQELAVRAALGASRARILRELLVESGLLGIAGAVVAVFLAYAALHLLVRIGPANLPRLSEISLDAKAVLFTFVLALVSSLLCGSISALKYAGPQVSAGLRSAGRTFSHSRERHRARNILVIGQVTMAVLLLITAGLMIRTFQRLRDVAPGFTDGRHLQTIRTSIPDSLIREPERVTRTQQEIAEKLAAIPGVSSVAFTDQMPMEDFGSDWDEIQADSPALTGKVLPLRLFRFVSPEYFHTAGTRILAGREFSWQDIYGQRPVVLISENLARELWGTPSAALGKHVREFKGMPWLEVIGIVENTRENGVDKEAPAIVYWPPLMKYLFGRKELDAVRAVTFVLRTRRAGTEAFVRELREAVWSAAPGVPVASVRTMRDVYDRSLSRTSFTLTMLGIAAGMALILGVIGIYGVISYAVAQRSREIGIRLALGAQQRELKRMFVRSGLILASIGVTIGLLAAVGVTRVMKSMLFGISPLDPITYVSVPAVLAMVTLLASYVPARRAALVDPVQALKAE
ncbi:MAG: ABC transporter permease [Acidobacteriaceae bacterium]|nr:ABC transporter permease [Acidobacteriaceae bacterium]